MWRGSGRPDTAVSAPSAMNTEPLTSRSARIARVDPRSFEPRVPAALLTMDNVVLLPHVGSATHETRKAMGDLCKANLDAWFAGKPLPTLIGELG